MADHVRLTLELGTDGDEPVGSLDHPATGRSRRFWGWLELIAAVEECVRQLGPANTEEQEQEHPATLTDFLTDHDTASQA